MNLLFQGYYGNQNTGDDAFIEVVSWGAKEYWNNRSCKFISQSLPIIQTKSECTGKNYFRGQHFLKTLNSIVNADALIIAGGSTFHSQLNFRDPKSLAQLKKRYSPKFKMGAIGVSLGPYKSAKAENENIELFKNFDFLTLRDEKSYKLACTYNLPFLPVEAFDLAALLPKVYKDLPIFDIPKKSKKILGISLCNYESYLKKGDIKNEKRRNEQLEKLLLEIAKYNSNIIFRFFIFNGNSNVGDEKLTMYVANKIRTLRPLNVEIVSYSPDVYATWINISECNFVLSTRLHAAIFACFSTIPFYLIEYHQKCSDFLNTIGYYPNYRLWDAAFDPEEIAQNLINFLKVPTTFNSPKYLSKAIKMAELNFTYPSKILI